MRTKCNARPCNFLSPTIFDEINEKYPEANGNSNRAAEIAAGKLEDLYTYMMRINTEDRPYNIGKRATYMSDGDKDWLDEKNPVNAPAAQKLQNEENILTTELFFYRDDYLVDGPGTVAPLNLDKIPYTYIEVTKCCAVAKSKVLNRYV